MCYNYSNLLFYVICLATNVKGEHLLPIQKEMINKISLAALLHDCGKIVQRASGERQKHSLLGRKFLEKYCADPDILKAVAYHHSDALKTAKLPDNHMAYIIYEADNIASGTDRRDEEDSPRTFYREMPLESIFDHLREKCSEDKKRYHYLRGLEEQGKINYGIAKNENILRASKDKYDELLKYLENNLNAAVLDKDGIDKDKFSSIESAQMLRILEAICSYIPSSTARYQAEDVSLYDHLKMTAAIANSMYLYFLTNKIDNYKMACFSQTKKYREKSMFLLISGDISGIQKFIYTVSSAGALKSLRGRSFYLDMVLEYIIDELCEAIGVNRCNLIYSGGGHFYLLAPNTQEVIDKIEKIKDKCNYWFLKNTSSTLYIEIACQECSAINFMDSSDNEEYGKTSNIFYQLSNKLSKQKMQRYEVEQLKEMFDPMSDINKVKDSSRECVVCHNSAKLDFFAGDHDKETYACPLCNGLYNFGKNILDKNVPEEKKKKYFIVIANDKGLPLPVIDDNTYSLHAMNEKEAEKCDRKKIRRIYTKNVAETGNLLGTNLWVGDYNTKLPDDKDNITTADFSYLAEQSRGINRLGILRADVDILGQTFATAFRNDEGDHYVTLSRIATLSRQLSLFFKKYINYICQGHIAGEGEVEEPIFSLYDREPGERKISIVYSGGDDVFVVGAWNEVLEFAVDLRTALRRFTSKQISISAGVAILNASYPISQMANIAGQLESLAKDKGRDRIALFNTNEGKENKNIIHCYKWDEFIENVIGEKMQCLVNSFAMQNNSLDAENNIFKGNLSIGSSQFHKLLEFLQKKLSIFDKEQNSSKQMNIIRFIYWLARLEPDKASEEVKKTYGKIRKALYQWVVESDVDASKQLLTAVSLLLYSTRTRFKNEN